MSRAGIHQSTPLAATDWTLAGFGTTASKTVTAGSSDLSGKLNVTSAGTGQLAGATATLTFKDGVFPTAPFAVVCRGSTGDQLTVPITVSMSTSVITITFQGTPVAGQSYEFIWAVFGGS